MYYIYEKVVHGIICYLHDCNHGNKIILEMLGGFVLSSMENLNRQIFYLFLQTIY